MTNLITTETTMTRTTTHPTAAGRRTSGGVSRLVRHLERQRRTWMRRDPDDDPVPTETAWRAGVAEGLRLAQISIRRGV